MIEFTLYRKKPVHVTAVQFDGTGQGHIDVNAWAEELIRQGLANEPSVRGADGAVFAGDLHGLYIETLHGRLLAVRGDWVVCGAHGTFYRYKPDAFHRMYERVEQ